MLERGGYVSSTSPSDLISTSGNIQKIDTRFPSKANFFPDTHAKAWGIAPSHHGARKKFTLAAISRSAPWSAPHYPHRLSVWRVLHSPCRGRDFIYLFICFPFFLFFMLPIISKCLRKCGYDYCIENMSLLPLKCKRLPNQPESRTTFPHLL